MSIFHLLKTKRMKIFQKLSFSLIGFLYIIVVGGLCHILPIPEIAKGFLALPGFLIIPYLVGNPLSFQIKKVLHIQYISLGAASNFVLSWLLGLSIIYFLYTFFWLLGIHSFMIFMCTLFALIMVINMYKIKHSNIHNKFFSRSVLKEYNILVLFLLIIIFLSYSLSHHIIPIGGSYGQYSHVFLAYSFLTNVPLNLLMDEGGYFSYIPLLYAINSLIFNILPISLISFLPFLLIFVFIGGVYKFTFQVTKNKQIAIISVIISVWVFDYTGYFKCLTIPIPKTLLFSIFPWILFLIQKHFLDNYNNNEKIDTSLFLYTIFSSIVLFIFFLMPVEPKYIYVLLGIILFSLLLLFFYKKLNIHKNIFLFFGFINFILISIHADEGPLFVFLMFVYIISYIFLNNKEFCGIFNKIMVVGGCVIFLFFLLQYVDLLQFKETALLSKYIFKLGVGEEYEILFFDKYLLLLNSNSVTIWYLFFIGLTFAFFSKLKFVRAVAFSSIIMYFFYFFPENQFMRASIGQSIVFFSIIISFGLFEILKSFKKHYSKHIPTTYHYIVILLIFIVVNGATEPYLKNAEILEIQGQKVQVIENYEMIAFQWIALNTPKDSVIFSDPYTSNFIKTNSFRSNYFRLIWPATERGLNQTLEYMDEMKKIFSIENAKEMRDEMTKVKKEIIEQRVNVAPRMILFKDVNVNSPFYIVVSGRTCEWLKREKRIIVSYTVPTNFKITEDCINKFNDTEFFEQVYSDDDKIFIFKVKNQNESAKH